MIKKLQKLKAKKGFTLVELIVVIAIIGVLAAILIPTMIGYVRNANITSADQTAASIRKTITNTISSMETKGCTLKGTGTVKISEISNNGGANSQFTFGTIAAAGGEAAAADAVTVSGKKPAGGNWSMDDMKAAWKEALEKDLKEIKAGTAIIVIKNGVCTQVAYSSSSTVFAAINEVTPGSFRGANCDEGIINGDIVGTNPKVTKDGGTNDTSNVSSN